jgi:hypothetical protein
VQVAIGFGRKAGADPGGVWLACSLVGCITGAASPAALVMGAFSQIFLNNLSQKVAGLLAFFVQGCGCGRRGQGGFAVNCGGGRGGHALILDFRGFRYAGTSTVG